MTTRRRVLVVDDDEDIRDLLTILLGSAGYDVEAAKDGLEALERLSAPREPPRVVLLDLMMPRLDGRAFLERMRRDPALPPIPVIIMSGHNEARQQAFELGAAACLVKPVEFADLLNSVRRVENGDLAGSYFHR